MEFVEGEFRSRGDSASRSRDIYSLYAARFLLFGWYARKGSARSLREAPARRLPLSDVGMLRLGEPQGDNDAARGDGQAKSIAE